MGSNPSRRVSEQLFSADIFLASSASETSLGVNNKEYYTPRLRDYADHNVELYFTSHASTVANGIYYLSRLNAVSY